MARRRCTNLVCSHNVAEDATTDECHDVSSSFIWCNCLRMCEVGKLWLGLGIWKQNEFRVKLECGLFYKALEGELTECQSNTRHGEIVCLCWWQLACRPSAAFEEKLGPSLLVGQSSMNRPRFALEGDKYPTMLCLIKIIEEITKNFDIK